MPLHLSACSWARVYKFTPYRKSRVDGHVFQTQFPSGAKGPARLLGSRRKLEPYSSSAASCLSSVPLPPGVLRSSRGRPAECGGIAALTHSGSQDSLQLGTPRSHALHASSTAPHSYILGGLFCKTTICYQYWDNRRSFRILLVYPSISR